MKHTPDNKKMFGQKPMSKTTMDKLYRTVAKQVTRFYQRWSKAARKQSAQRSGSTSEVQ